MIQMLCILQLVGVHAGNANKKKKRNDIGESSQKCIQDMSIEDVPIVDLHVEMLSPPSLGFHRGLQNISIQGSFKDHMVFHININLH